MLKEEVGDALELLDGVMIRSKDEREAEDLFKVRTVLAMLYDMIECEEVTPEELGLPK